MSNEKPMVSVVMITYGHEKFIEKAINGVLMQETNFLIEFIISNDCSPDNTDAVIKKLIKKIPSNIILKYTYHKNNLGMMKNHYWALKQATGKYIAICEGDDYWINKNKLQVQFDFMESNTDYAICCHNYKTLEDNLISEKSFIDDINTDKTYSITDLSKNNFIAPLTSFFVNKKISFPEWTNNAPLGDLILFLHLARYGKIKYINEKWAIYRKNVGIWHKNKKEYYNMILLYENLSKDFLDIPDVSNNLDIIKKRYVKAYLKEQSFRKVTKNKYFHQLSLIEKIKLIIKKII